MEPINGLYGFLFDENGEQVQMTSEFETNLDYNKTEYLVPGKFLTSHKVVNGAASGSFTVKKVDSRLQKKIGENPHAKYNYLAKLADPTVNGEEAILYSGVSFDGTPLLGYNLEELVEYSVDFTFDDWRYVSTIDG
ncbi:phage tail tube protein [Metabacillus fastidiosus]|uniref:phage tail tube protein n=1 Tax=Metabacillus fastidiosus TaxID=1458 RepID=UPI003D2B18AE